MYLINPCPYIYLIPNGSQVFSCGLRERIEYAFMIFRFGEEFDSNTRIDALFEFIEYWMGPGKPEYGIPIEKDRGLLPPPLLRIIEFAGNWPGRNGNLLSNQNFLTNQVHVSEDERIHVIYENQNVCDWVTEPAQEDPPVWNMGEYDDEWKKVNESLTSFLIIHCLYEITFGSRFWLWDTALEDSFANWERTYELTCLSGFNREASKDVYKFDMIEGEVIRMQSPYVDPTFAAQSDMGIQLLNRFRSRPSSVRFASEKWECTIDKTGSFEIAIHGGDGSIKDQDSSALGEADSTIIDDLTKAFFLMKERSHDRELRPIGIQFFTGSSDSYNHISVSDISPFISRLSERISVQGPDFGAQWEQFHPLN